MRALPNGLIEVRLGAEVPEAGAPANVSMVRCPFRDRWIPLDECLECYDADGQVEVEGQPMVRCNRLVGPYQERP
jgi:hypothetical protein